MSDVEPGAAPGDGRPQMARAVVLVIVVVVVAVLVLRHTGSSSPAGRTARGPGATTTTTLHGPTTTTTTVPVIPPAQITVQVLNGLISGPLAGNLTTRLHADGYQTLAANDTTAGTTTSVVYVVGAKYHHAAVELARKLGLKAADVKRHIPTTAPIPVGVVAKADIIVVIGTSLQQLAATA